MEVWWTRHVRCWEQDDNVSREHSMVALPQHGEWRHHQLQWHLSPQPNWAGVVLSTDQMLTNKQSMRPEMIPQMSACQWLLFLDNSLLVNISIWFSMAFRLSKNNRPSPPGLYHYKITRSSSRGELVILAWPTAAIEIHKEILSLNHK